jgi:transient receptor potential cation channel subfamily A protein 1
MHLFRNATLWTPMDCAAYNGHEKVIRILIEAGADVNPTDKLQITPLHLASQEGHLNAVKVLLDNGAEVGKISGNNLNSLDMAIDYGHE